MFENLIFFFFFFRAACVLIGYMDPDSMFAKLRTIFFSLSRVVSVSGLRGSDRDPDVLIGYTDPDSMFRKLGPIFFLEGRIWVWF